jgi:glycosyltransferase involved in cell wall biosynthesis/peptidoglycan/xylan/chitin deacetylase (PgdA/CDA1 family)
MPDTAPLPVPDVSIVVPVLDAEAWLEECLISALNQTMEGIEVVCVDDGSSDGSGEILEKAAARDARVRVIRHENTLGAAAARNTGLAAARGRFVRMLDADDLLPRDSTALLFDRAQETGAEIVRGALALFESEGGAGKLPIIEPVSDRRLTDFRSEPQLWKPFWHTSYLIATDLIRANGIEYPQLSRGEDPVFLAKVLLTERPVSLTSDIVYLYRRYRKTSGSRSRDSRALEDYLTHGALVKALYACHPKSWTQGYAPFLRKGVDRLLAKSRLTEEEAARLDRKARELFDDGASGPADAPPPPPAPEVPDEEAPPVSLPQDHWERVFARRDPWNYASAYEARKYDHTLELLPDGALVKAAEFGCAEGRFTERLALRVGTLDAFDLSAKALERARQRCEGLDNVSFFQRDLVDGLPDGDYDLILCSEVLYYLRDRAAIAAVARRLSDALRPGGHVLMANPNMVCDDKESTGFDFNTVGARSFAAIFSSIPGLEYVRELRTDLYRIQLFRRRADEGPGAGKPHAAAEVQLRAHAPLEHAAIKWGGCAVTAAEARFLSTTTFVPVLLYHRVTDDPHPELADYAVSPAMFERQLAWLQRHGYRSLRLGDLHRTWYGDGAREIAGRPIVITFDDAFADFHDEAWPLLRKYGFDATVFVPVDHVGGTAAWDGDAGTAALMTWEQIQSLSRAGVDFGSHGCGHRLLTKLSDEDALDEAVRSRTILEEKLSKTIEGLAYPWNQARTRERKLVRRAGYGYAVGRLRGEDPDLDNPYYIPRIEILGSDTLDGFVARLPGLKCADAQQEAEFRRRLAKGDRTLYMRR